MEKELILQTISIMIFIIHFMNKGDFMTKYNIDTAHSSIQFIVRHMMISRVYGTFESYTSDIVIEDVERIDEGQFNIDIDVASVSTKNTDRDRHLISEDFFDADLFPKITFKSTSITKVDGDDYDLLGDLTIKGCTLPTLFKLKYLGHLVNPWGQEVLGFNASTTIERDKFNLLYNAVLETGGMVISNEVEVTIELQLNPA